MNAISAFAGSGGLVVFLVKATVLLVAAMIAMIPLRRSTAGARHLVWLGALAGLLALPLLSRFAWLRLPVLPSALVEAKVARAYTASAPATASAVSVSPVNDAGSPVAARAPASVGAYAAAAPAPLPAPIVAAGDSPVEPLSPSTLLTILAGVWGAVALVLAGWLAAGTWSVRRIVTGGRALTSPDWTTPLCEVADRLDLEMPPRLVMSDRIEMAFACRAFTPTVVLPASAESWTDDRRRAVLFHELAHVKRHDLVGHTLGRLACALYWFHPLVWTAAKHLRAESERACDDLVLRCGARPSEYAQHLLDMVTSVRHHGTPVMALPMARRKEFEGRMLAILDPAIRRASPGRWQVIGVAATLALLSVTVAAASPTAVSQTGSDTPVATPVARAAAMAPEPAPAVRAMPTGVPRTATPAVRGAAPVAPIPTVALPTSVTGQASSSADAIGSIVRTAVGTATSVALSEISRALRGLADVPQAGDTARAAVLIRILASDGDASVRRVAAWGMQQLHGANVAAALGTALRQDADASVREMAAWALAEYPRDSAATRLAGALRTDRDANVRATAAWALGQLGSQTEMSALEHALDDTDADARFAAIWAIGQAGVRRAPATLARSLRDSQSRVRLVTAWALGEIEDTATAGAITSAFQSETSPDVRSAELRALAAMDRISPELVDLALRSTDADLRRRAVAMLAGSGAGVWPWPWPWPQPRPVP